MESSMGGKNKRKNIFLTDEIAQKAFCVGGIFYPIIINNNFWLF